MGDGLKRAQQAAMRTRINQRHIDFLTSINAAEVYGGQGTGRWALPPADRAQDRIRQFCRKAGLVKYIGGGWRLTEAGRKMIRQAG